MQKELYLIFLLCIACCTSLAQAPQVNLPWGTSIKLPHQQHLGNGCGFHRTQQQVDTIKNNSVFQQTYRDYLNNYGNRALRSIDYIPIKAHIVRTSAGTGGLTVTELNAAITTMNTYYINASMQFYLCDGINFIDDNNYYDFDKVDESALDGAEGVSNLINIYFCNTITSNGDDLCGYAYLPGGSDIIMMKNNCTTNGSTLSHEMGHFFGLDHTHGGTNDVLTSELVDGSNCGTHGDGICDTPADPQLGNSNVSSNCTFNNTTPYTGGVNTDANGDVFVPDPNNIMSYSRKSCRNVFTPGQYSHIRAGYTMRNYFTCPSVSNQGPVYSIVNTATLPNCGLTKHCNSSWTNSTYYGGEIQATASINGNQITFVVSKCDGTPFAHSANYGIREFTCNNNNTNIAGGTYSSGNNSFTVTTNLPSNFTGGVKTYYVMTNPAGSHFRTGGITVSANSLQASAPNLQITGQIGLNPSSSTITQGDLRTVNVEVTNTGSAWAGNIHLKIISSMTNQILRTHVVAIGSNRTQTINFSNVSFTNPPGNYALQLAYEPIGTSNQITLPGNPASFSSKGIQIHPNGTNVILQPNFSVPGGSYLNSQFVVLSNPNQQGAIYYTEGTSSAATPNTTVGTLYTVPIQVTNAKVIKAVVIHNGQTSNVRTETYTITSSNSLGAVTHTISGFTKDGVSLQPIAGVLVALNSNTGTLSTTSDVYGAYSFTVPDGWTGQINAAKVTYQTSSSINLGPLTGNTTTDITLNPLPLAGDLTVNVLPSSIQNSGRWREQNTSTWYPSGYTLSNLSTGPIAIEFKNIGNNWTTPTNQTIVLGNGESKVIDAQYTNGAFGLNCSGCMNKLRVNTQPLDMSEHVATYPTFSWEHELGKGINSYHLYVTKVATPSIIEFDQIVNVTNGNNWVSYQVITSNKLDHDEDYRWKLVGLDLNNTPVACLERFFSTYPSPDKDPNPTCTNPCTSRDIAPNLSTEPYGTPLGSSKNVVVYKNGDCGCLGGSSYRTYMGRATQYPINGSKNPYGWQCTEYVYRYYKQVYGLNIRSGHAKSYADLVGNRRGIKSYMNGQTSMLPQLGDYVVYDYGTYGHVAIVDRVEAQGGNIYHVYLAQQNVGLSASNHTSRLKILRQESNGNFSLLNGTGRDANCVGWFRAKPTITSPGNTTSFATVNTLSPDYVWEKQDGIKEYELFIVELDNNGCGTLHHHTTITNNSVNNTTIPPLQDNTKYKWRVFAHFHNGGTAAGDAYYFETNASTWNTFSSWALGNNGGSSSIDLVTLGSVLSGANVYTKIGAESYYQGTTDFNGRLTAKIGQTPSFDDSIKVEAAGYMSVIFLTNLLLQNSGHVGIPMFENTATQAILPKVSVASGNNVVTTNSITFRVHAQNITGYEVFGEEGSNSLFFGIPDTLITVSLQDTGLNMIGFSFFNAMDTITLSYPVYYTPSILSSSNYSVHISNPNQAKGKLYVDNYYLHDINASANVLLPSGNHIISIQSNGTFVQSWDVDSITPVIVYVPQDRLPMNTTQTITTGANQVSYIGASVSTRSNGSNSYEITRTVVDYTALRLGVLGESIELKKSISNTDAIDILVYVDINQQLDTSELYILKETNNTVTKSSFNQQFQLDTISQKWSLLGLTEDSSTYSIAIRQPPVPMHPIMNGFLENDTLLLPVSYFFGDPDNITQDLSLKIDTYNTGELAVSLVNDTIRIYSVGGFIGTSMVTLTATHDDVEVTKIFYFDVFPALNLGNDTVICNGGSILLDAGFNSGFLYEWSMGAFTSSITVLTSGVYSVKVTNILTGSIEEDSINVVINENPANNIISANTLTACEGQSITLSGLFGTQYQYQWFHNGGRIPNAKNQYYAAINAGIYHLEIDVETCVYTTPSITLNFISAPDPNVNVGINPVCIGDSVTIQAVPNSGWTYSWKKDGLPISGAVTSSYEAISTGNYSVIITDSVCASTSSIIPIEIKDYPQTGLLILGDTTFCSSDSVLLASITGLGYNYQWYQNNNLLLGKNASILSLSSSGQYYCVIDNGACSTSTNSVSITVFPEPSIVLNNTSTAQFCLGDAVVLNANTGNGITYEWYKDEGLLSGFNNTSYTASTTGLYHIEGTLNGCTGRSNSIPVTVHPRASKGISVIGGSSLCQGQTKHISVEHHTNYSYQWYYNNVQITNIDTSTMEVGVGGDYWAIITTDNGCIDTTQVATVVIANNPPPSVPTIIQTGTTLVVSPILSGVFYQWYVNGFASSTGAFINTSATGNYTVVVTNVSGCASVADTSILMTFPTAYIQTNSSSICVGDSLLLESVNDSSYSYQWLHNGDTIVGATMANYWAKQLGNYRVIVRHNGLDKLSNIVSVNVSAVPSIFVSNNGTTTLCQGQDVVLNASTSAPFIQWYKNDTAIIGEVFTNYTTNEAGYYNVEAVDINGCSVLSSNLLVEVYDYPNTSLLSASKITICEGDSLLIEAVADSLYQYIWTNNGLSITNSNNNTLWATHAGNYKVHIDNQGCIDSSQLVNLSIVSLPIDTIVVDGNVTFCEGDTVRLKASTIDNYQYQWYQGGQALLQETDSILNVTLGGVYWAVVGNQSCNVVSDTIAIIVHPLPTIELNYSDTISFCESEQLNLSAVDVSNYVYQWYLNGATILNANAATYVVDTVGIYNVITSNGNCSTSSDSIWVTIDTLPTQNLSHTGTIYLCEGDTIILSSTPYATSYQWLLDGNWLAGDTLQDIAISNEGVYHVMLTKESCLAHSETVEVMAVSLSQVSLYGMQNSVICSGDSAFLFTEYIPNTNYQWFLDGQPIQGGIDAGQEITGGGTYTVVVNQNNCTDSVSVTLMEQALSPQIVLHTDTLWTNYANGDVYLWYQNGLLIDSTLMPWLIVTANGNYHVIVQDSVGCTGQSNTLGVTTLEVTTILHGNLEIVIAPNPNNGSFSVYLSNLEEENIHVIFTDVLGRVIFSTQIEQVHTSTKLEYRNGQRLATGVYFLSVLGENNRVIGTKKVIIQ